MDTTALVYKILCAHNGYFELEEMRANFSTPEDDLESVLGNQDMFTSAVFEGNELIFAKTKMRLCRDKECNGCSNLHLCIFYLYGTCRFNEGQRCRFCHELTSEYNIRVLREHHLEKLDRRELCVLLQQNDNTLLPPVCFTYNKGSGEYGYCPDKESCRRLHVCERYIRGTCAADVDCGRSHDFNEPHPLNTLQQRGVPNELVASMLYTYRNIQAIQYEEGSRPVCHPPPPPPPPQTYFPAPNVVQRETHYIHLQPIIVHSQVTPSMLCNFKLKSRPFVQTKPKSHTKPSSSASHQSKPSKPPTPAPHQSKSSKPPTPAPHQSKSSKAPPPTPQQSKSSKAPPPTPQQSKSSKAPPPTPQQSKSSKAPPPTPQQSKSSKAPPPTPQQSKSSKAPPPTPAQSKSSKAPPPTPQQSKSSKPHPPATHQSKSSQPAPHQPKTTKAPPSARRR
ncbi:protein mono-ADP-ribosyltransferase PARP12-like [Salvelinus fontinalis]|uniref:protein mono-ADP-ribosyltransferase PARP12-like n=1 Tax=Salvelinus fontinalis TaxID=8038 RepID=UPI002486A33E|nr:protein mono-ADP-ribosyltransferase PARP12-like [Salvelinus fontinalis]